MKALIITLGLVFCISTAPAADVTVSFKGAECPGTDHLIWNGTNTTPYLPARLDADIYQYVGGNFGHVGDFDWVLTNWTGSNVLYQASGSYPDWMGFYVRPRYPDLCAFHEANWKVGTFAFTKTPTTWTTNAMMLAGQCYGSLRCEIWMVDCCTLFGYVASGWEGPSHPVIMYPPTERPPWNPPPVLNPPPIPGVSEYGFIQYVTGPNLGLKVTTTTDPSSGWVNYTNLVTDDLGYVEFEWFSPAPSAFLQISATNSP